MFSFGQTTSAFGARRVDSFGQTTSAFGARRVDRSDFQFISVQPVSGAMPVDGSDVQSVSVQPVSDNSGIIGSISERRKDVDFTWTIPNYFSLIGNASEYFDSPAFSFSGCSWYIRVYPTGSSSSNPPWISLYLYKDDSDTPKDMAFTIGIRKLDNTSLNRKAFCNKNFIGQLGWGWCKHTQKETLFETKSELTTSDALDFICSMQDGTPPEVDVAPQPMRLIALEPLSSSLRDLFMSKSNCDVTIKVKNREFQAHRTILMARSPVFAAMFQHEMFEKNSGRINIDDCDSDSFEDFLRYLYTGKAENLSFRNAYHLYSTANKYDFRELKNYCVSHIIRNLTVKNVCDVLILADHHEDSELISSTQFFFNINASAILSTPEWETLSKENYVLANRIFREMASKTKV